MKLSNLNVRQTVQINQRGELEPVLDVEFTLDSQGPFSARIPKSEFTRERVIEEAKQVANSLQGLEGEEV
jgi:hypothetical protein